MAARLEASIMGESIWLEGFREGELEEVFEWFAGAIDQRSGFSPSFTIRIVRSTPDIPSRARTLLRHRASLRPKTCFLDGREFDQLSQIREVSVILESPDFALLEADGALIFATPATALIVAAEAPRLLLADIIENWLLWRAREGGLVMAHASGWIRDGQVEMFVGSSGDGKTTELLRSVQSGATYFANDRIALRVEGEHLLGRSFPEPINVGCGAIRALGLDLPTFDLADKAAIRLLAAEVFSRWRPDFYGWYPIARIRARDRAALESNLYWEGDPDHPFWNLALRPRRLTNRHLVESAVDARLSLGSGATID